MKLLVILSGLQAAKDLTPAGAIVVVFGETPHPVEKVPASREVLHRLKPVQDDKGDGVFAR